MARTTIETDRPKGSPPAFQFRRPKVADASELLDIVRDSGVLEPNSCYSYLMWCREFDATSVVALAGEEVVGFVAGLIPPQRQTSLFVWQIGVRASARRQGLAHQMLAEIFQTNRQLQFLEATITPGNNASRKMFESFAKRQSVEFQYHDWFKASDFDQGDHECEELIRIGPFHNAFFSE